MSKCSKIEQIPEVVAYACNPSTQEAEAKGLPQLRGQTRLHSESKTSLNYISIPCLKKREKKEQSGPGWGTSAIPVFGRLRKEDFHEFEATLSFIMSSRQV